MAPMTRRAFMGAALAAAPLPAATRLWGLPPVQEATSVHPRFPAQDDAAVLAAVRFSHFDLDRVRELVEARPELAKASWDWGYGDWETALGAASHTGNHAIAELLLEHGAPPTLFSATALGQLDVVRSMVEAAPGIQSQPGPHGIPLLEHARLAGERARDVAAYLEEAGGADRWPEATPYEVAREDFFGRYRFGPGEDDLFVAYDQRGALMLKRGEVGTGRALTHRGGHVFHPAGAPSVRIVFEVEDGTPLRLTVHDPEPLVTATRVG